MRNIICCCVYDRSIDLSDVNSVAHYVGAKLLDLASLETRV
ncbi:hypothetical protein CASFOL_021143 [Castilleja foliolosa]|uniref:Uncharacterized protein n=1 Tax=Castilleja foliolosa TaxID=1961234 RepID=A0ABD3CY90_9LAMI